MGIFSEKTLNNLRCLVQWCFMFWVVVIGIRFGLFVNSIQNGSDPSLLLRPPGVEGFLPIGALVSLKYWLLSGIIHPVHPAALIIFLAILLMSLLAKKSFCSWFCPVGTLSEAVHKLGRKMFGPGYRVWRWLDIALRGIKYLLLLFFIKFILLDMSVGALKGFLDAPYWAVSDVKMLYFFTHMSVKTVVVLVVLTLLSVFYKMFWCRYLCPYGALLGLVSMFSPFKIRRDQGGCTGCRRCTVACPSDLPVHDCKAVSSPECTGCLTCVGQCPERNVLAMQPVLWSRPLKIWVFPAFLLFVFFAVIGFGMAGGHWHTILSSVDYQELLPLLHLLSH